MRKLLLCLSIVLFSTLSTYAQGFDFAQTYGGSSLDDVLDIHVDSQGNSYVVGRFFLNFTVGGTTYQAPGFSYDIFLVKYNAAGAVQWVKLAGSSNQDIGRGVTTDALGNVYITGSCAAQLIIAGDTIAANSGFVASYTSTGADRWAIEMDGNGTINQDYIADIEYNASSGEMNVSGSYSGSATFGSLSLPSSTSQAAFVGSIDTTSTPNVNWVEGFGSTDANYSEDIIVDPSGDIFFSGSFGDSITIGTTTLIGVGGFSTSSLYVGKLSSSGTGLGAVSVVASSFSQSTDLAVDNLGRPIITARLGAQGTVGTTTIPAGGSVIRFTNALAYDNHVNLGTTLVIPNGLDVSPTNDIAVTGQFFGSMTLSGQQIISAGSYDIFFLRLSSSFGAEWLTRAGSTVTFNAEQGQGIKFHNDDVMYATGRHQTGTVFGKNTINGLGSWDGYLTRIVECNFPIADLPPGQDSVLCGTGDVITLNATPVGSADYQWLTSGSVLPGANMSSYQVTGSGSYSVEVDSLGCYDTSDVHIVTLGNLPAVSAPSNLNICEGAAPFTLTGGTPVGGTWSGTGVTGNTFSPAVAGLGYHNLTYTVTDPSSGCSNSETMTVGIIANPTVILLPFSSSYCETAPAFSLVSNGLPSGGTFSGPGVSGSTFDPSVAGPGTHAIYYTITNSAGCSDSATQNITVTPAPTISLPTVADQCFTTFSVSIAGASPSGGTWSGNGVIGSLFYPFITGPGSFDLVYTAGTSGCQSSDTLTIQVDSTATADLAPLADVCLNGGLVPLNGTPTGGVFSGTGVVGSNFDPSIAGAGSYNITYTYTNACGSANDVESINVDPLPVVNMPNLGSYCETEAAFTLNQGTPSGGSYSGPGVSGTTFNPATAGVGTHFVVYTYTDGNGCTNADSGSVTITATPSASISPIPDVCVNAAPITLNQGSPSGGSWSGTGVSGSTFDPSVAGVGTHTITYIVTVNGCSDTATTSVVVLPLPSTTLSAFADICLNDAPLTLSGGAPTGGVYSGTGVSGGVFNPSVAGVGTHTITYTASNGCGSTNTTATITVLPLPAITFTGPGTLCVSASPVGLSASPSGGVFSGPGVSASTFNPATAGVGTHNVVYSYTDGNGCTASDTEQVVVITAPAVTLNNIPNICINSTSNYTLVEGVPSGGVYSGPGVVGGVFSPSVAGVGTHQIIYTVTASGCSASDTNTITVDSLPSVSIAAISDFCVNDTAYVLSEGSPVGGGYYGPGVVNSVFYPALAGAGTHFIKYADTNSCGIDVDSTAVVVHDTASIAFSLPAGVCLDNGVIALSASPTGGVYLGTGVLGSTFDPAIAGVGVHSVVYSYTNANGCTTADTQTIEVYPLPVVSLAPLNDMCLNDSSLVLSGGLPLGGTYSGTGVSGGVFNPAIAGVGVHNVIYTYTDSNSCLVSDTQSIEVFGLPTVSLAPLADMCSNEPVDTLQSGLPAGGTYFGFAVSGPVLDPSIVLPGTDTVYYTFTDINGCADTAAQTLTVHMAPSVTWQPLPVLCADTALITLPAGSPTGGVYTGVGVVGNTFDASVSGAGTFTLQYSFTDANGCSDSTSEDIIVSPLPIVSLDTFAPVCANDPPFVLTGGLPLGGTYSGVGVSGGSFDPSVGSGSYTIYYTYSDSISCTAVDSQTIAVLGAPVASLNLVDTLCGSVDSLLLTGGSPAGGFYFGNNVSGGYLYPQGTGNDTVYYILSGGSCSDTAMDVIYIDFFPSLTISNPDSLCSNDPAFTLTASPAGGVFSGPGVIGNTFDPAFAGVGSHIIMYEYISGSCSDSIFDTIVVDSAAVITMPSFAALCQGTGGFTLSGASPAGGTFNGAGVYNGQFFPDSVSAGQNTIYYSFTNGAGCVSTDSTTILVNPAPTALLASIAPLCAIDDSVLLVGSPIGGSYFGTGVSGNQFFSAGLAPGSYQVGYTYTNITGCSDTAYQNAVVNPLPSVSLAAFATVCSSDSAFVLSGGLPVGGTYTVNGVTQVSYDPSLYGVGTDTIVYNYSDTNGCSSADTQLIQVISGPTLTINSQLGICVNDTAVVLNLVSPAGGTYAGPGISGGVFDPAVAGIGQHIYTYTTSNSNGCTAVIADTITVYAAPAAIILDPGQICETENLVPLTGLPSGGVFSGAGVSGSSFDPSIVGAGNHPVYYTYTSGLGCSTSDTIEIEVNGVPGLTVSPDTAICYGDSAFLEASGASEYLWNIGPTTAEIGVQPFATTTYYVMGVNGACRAYDTTIVSVELLPNPNLGGFYSIEEGDTINFDPGTFDSYLWVNGQTATSFEAVYPDTGWYMMWVEVTSALGCVGSDTAYIQVIEEYVSGLDDLELSDKFTVFPNPSLGVFNIELDADELGDWEMMVLDASGRAILSQDVQVMTGANQWSVDIQFAERGYYLLVMVREDGKRMSRVLVKD